MPSDNNIGERNGFNLEGEVDDFMGDLLGGKTQKSYALHRSRNSG
jgi:hypothetical protein